MHLTGELLVAREVGFGRADARLVCRPDGLGYTLYLNLHL